MYDTVEFLKDAVLYLGTEVDEKSFDDVKKVNSPSTMDTSNTDSSEIIEHHNLNKKTDTVHEDNESEDGNKRINSFSGIDSFSLEKYREHEELMRRAAGLGGYEELMRRAATGFEGYRGREELMRRAAGLGGYEELMRRAATGLEGYRELDESIRGTISDNFNTRSQEAHKHSDKKADEDDDKNSENDAE
jgi:hypothetical protein